MVFGHLAVGSLGSQYFFRRAGLPFCLIAAFGPDWIDKPLKLAFGLPGHFLAHSLLGSALLLVVFARLCRRWSLPDSWPAVAFFFWGLHLLCDLVRFPVLFWPLGGSFPVNAASTAELAWQFYTARPLSVLAWCDLALAAVALAARFGPQALTGPGFRAAWASRLTLGK